MGICDAITLDRMVGKFDTLVNMFRGDGVESGEPARVGGRDELAQGHEEQGGVEHVGVVVLDERPATGVPAALHDLAVDAVPGRAPAGMSAGRPRWQATRIARSTATQLISRE